MGFAKIFVLFLLWRLLDFLIIFLTPYFLPYLGFFPYKEILSQYPLPDFMRKLANFDGVHYLLIAQEGYRQYEQAFFPLYPLLIRLTTPLFFNNTLLAALFISNLAFLFGLYWFSHLLKKYAVDNKMSVISILLLFPTSFFFGAVYTEGLFFFLLVACLYFLHRQKYLTTIFFAFLASLTRLIGGFLIIPILFYWLAKYQKQVKNKHLRKPQRTNINRSCQLLPTNTLCLITLFSPLLGLAVYSFYLYQTTADPFFFFTAQPIFGANRSTNLILLPQVYFRYLKIFFTATFNFQFFIALCEFFLFNFIFLILIADFIKNIKLKLFPRLNYQIVDMNKLGLNLFSFANLLLPTLTGTLSSLPRYSLFSLSFFIYLAQMKNKGIKILMALIFFLFHLILLAFFSQGYFVS